MSRPEPRYQWHIEHTVEHPEFKCHVIKMTSQQWLTTKDVDQPVWRHWMTVTTPVNMRYSTAVLIVDGGRNGNDAPQSPSKEAQLVAAQTGTVVVELGQVPNQPLVFNGDGQPRVEDDLLAYASTKFMDTGDTEWIARLPMVKSVVKAMDTAQEVVKEKTQGASAIDKFIIVGASKRGWTTWLVGSADPRVAAVVPVVIDCLNTPKSMEHHFAAYGFWAPAVGDYERHGILDRLKSPEQHRLLSIDDPYNHRHRITMPKYVINSAGDQYFLPDSSQFYFDELVGEKHLRYIPNTDHSLDGSDVVDSLVAFCRTVLQGQSRPKYSWSFGADGSIDIECGTLPLEVRMWQANNPTARDFRLQTIGPTYQSTKLKAISQGRYMAARPEEKQGWTAYFVEMDFPSDDGPPLKFTSGVRVTPDLLPHANQLEHEPAAVGAAGQ
ncbi:MAG: PhoPQ-activated protein PqaA family protein [Bythopirellula sp.]